MNEFEPGASTGAGSDTRIPPPQAIRREGPYRLRPPPPRAGSQSPPGCRHFFVAPFRSPFEFGVKETIRRRHQPHRLRRLAPLADARAPSPQVCVAMSFVVDATEPA